MLRSKTVRLALVVLILLGVAAIAWSYLARRPDQRTKITHDLLSGDKTKNFKKPIYQQRKAGNLTFEVMADVSTESVTGLITLEQVRLVHYDEKGEPSNLVSGQKAVYRREEKLVEFSGDVKVKLADGTDVFSKAVLADLERQKVTISEQFRFQRGEATGEGQGLTYLVEERQLNVDGNFTLSLPTEDGPLNVRAAHALYKLNEYSVDLVGSASVVGGGRELKSDRIQVLMNEQNRVKEMVGEGNAALSGEQGRRFAGDRIVMRADPESKTMTHFEVTGKGATRARFDELTEKGRSTIESDRLVGSPKTEQGRSVGLESFVADGSVSIQSEPMGIVQAKSDHAVARFHSGGKNVEQVDLVGRVSVVRHAAKAETEETVTGRELSLSFLPNREIRSAKATGNVTLQSKGPKFQRILQARDMVNAIYKDGQIDQVQGRGDAQLEEERPGSKRVARAPEIFAFYQGGMLRRVQAEGGVTLEDRQSSGRTSRSSSKRLEALYDKGELTEVVQEGDVLHVDNREGTETEVRAGFSRYEARGEVLTVSGTPFPTVRYRQRKKTNEEQVAETVAETITMVRPTESLRAVGKVRSVFQGNEGLIVVRAGRMEADRKSGWVVYSERPRITQETSSIAGDEVRYNDRSQELLVVGSVDSQLSSKDQADKKYRILSDRLRYDRNAARARYEGSVRVTGPDLRMTAPYLDLVFESGEKSDLQELIAWGGVVVWQGERKVSGGRANYFPATQKVVMESG